jgi:hypothetical protein
VSEEVSYGFHVRLKHSHDLLGVPWVVGVHYEEQLLGVCHPSTNGSNLLIETVLSRCSGVL